MVDWNAVLNKLARWIQDVDQAATVTGDWPKFHASYAKTRDDLARRAGPMQEFLDRCGHLLGSAGRDIESRMRGVAWDWSSWVTFCEITLDGDVPGGHCGERHFFEIAEQERLEEPGPWYHWEMGEGVLAYVLEGYVPGSFDGDGPVLGVGCSPPHMVLVSTGHRDAQPGPVDVSYRISPYGPSRVESWEASEGSIKPPSPGGFLDLLRSGDERGVGNSLQVTVNGLVTGLYEASFHIDGAAAILDGLGESCGREVARG